MIRVFITAGLLAFAAPAWAQPSVDALRIYLGPSDTPCVIRSGSGNPAGALGCDLYIRWDGNQAIWGGDLVGQTSVSSVSDTPILGWWESDASANNRAWDVIADGEALRFRLVNDAYDSSLSWLTVDRTANVADIATFNVADILPAVNYTTDLGSLTNKYLTLHAAELWVETLVAADTMATIGGRVLVGPTTTLTSDLASGATSIAVKHNQIANGDRLVLQADLKLEWLAVTSGPSGTGPYTYTVTRNLDGSGANDWYAGDAVFNTGTTGDGFIDLYSVNGLVPGSTAGPTIVGNVRTGTTYNQVAPRWAIGNLNGLYGYGADTYGAAFGDPSAAWVKIDATNGVRLGHNTTTKIALDASGNASFVEGYVTINNAGVQITPTTTYQAPRSVTWPVANGTIAMQAFDAATERQFDQFVSTTDTGQTVYSSLTAVHLGGAKLASFIGSASNTTSAFVLQADTFGVQGETRLSGLASDGAGKVSCVKSDGYLGTCTNQPNGSGVCTCS